jgi:hypothetical protein
VFKVKFQAFLECKGLWAAIKEPESAEGKKASVEARGYLILYTQDAFVKLIVGETTAAGAWKKLKENFEKKSNARVVQVTVKLTSMKLGKRQSIAEYLGEFHEIKLDLEAAGQTVSNLQLAVHAMRGLPKEYDTLREILEAGEMELSLDNVQPKLMQRERTITLQAETKTAEAEVEGEVSAAAFAAWKHKQHESSREHKRGSVDQRACYCCGESGHIKAHCKHRDAECESCGKRGHLKVVCRKPSGSGERAAYAKENAGVAFTALRSGTGPAQSVVWLVDSSSTQHIAGERSQFTSYRELRQAETIEGIGGEPVTAVGVGVIELHWQTPAGVSTVTLQEVRHVPKARANLFALGRATDAGARVTIGGRVAQFELNGAVCMEAKEKNGLWEIRREKSRRHREQGFGSLTKPHGTQRKE